MRLSFVEPWKPRGWDRAAAAHLLRRAGFGPAPGELERAVERGFEATLAELTEPGAHDPALERGVRSLLALDEVEHIQAWWMSLMLAGTAPLTERLTLMWHDHFATSNDKVDDVRMMHAQNELLRSHGGGDFRVMLHAVAKDPAMLVWLDGNENKRGKPNENFAREVMELFALGIGNYTEQDVQEAARALTGWGTVGRQFEFRAADHDTGAKTIFGKRGDFDGEAAVELVLAHPACPRHIARRLLAEFATTAPSAHAVDEVARFFVESGWNVGATAARILGSEAFHAPELRRGRIAGPVELVVGTVRALDAKVPPALAARAATETGQSLFRPPSVKGWDGGRAWINAGTWVARHNALTRLARRHGEPSNGVRVDFERAFGSPGDSAEAGRAVIAALLPEAVGTDTEARIAEACKDTHDVDEALALATALTLTAPEYHFV